MRNCFIIAYLQTWFAGTCKAVGSVSTRSIHARRTGAFVYIDVTGMAGPPRCARACEVVPLWCAHAAIITRHIAARVGVVLAVLPNKIMWTRAAVVFERVVTEPSILTRR